LNGALRRGLALLVRAERTEALLWARLRFEKRQDAREPLFNRYAGLARSIASRHRSWGRSAAWRDAEQWAYTGLLQAIDAFDPLRGAPFEAYARRRIAGAVRDGFAKSSEMEAQLSARRRQQRERVGSLKAASIAAEDDPVECLGAIAASLAIGLILETRLAADERDPDPSPSAYEGLVWRQTQAKLVREIDRLPANEAVVVRQHYEHGLSFAQIALLLGLSRGRISQLHSAALLKLKKRMAKEY